MTKLFTSKGRKENSLALKKKSWYFLGFTPLLLMVVLFGIYLGQSLGTGAVVTHSVANGDWRFTSTISNSMVEQGTSVNLFSRYTYFGEQETSVPITSPILVWELISATNNSVIMSFFPSQITFVQNVSFGRSFVDDQSISTQGLQPGQYIFNIGVPEQEIGQDVWFNLTFSVLP